MSLGDTSYDLIDCVVLKVFLCIQTSVTTLPGPTFVTEVSSIFLITGKFNSTRALHLLSWCNSDICLVLLCYDKNHL